MALCWPRGALLAGQRIELRLWDATTDAPVGSAVGIDLTTPDRGVLRAIALPLREFDLIYQTRVLGNLRRRVRVGRDASSGYRRVTMLWRWWMPAALLGAVFVFGPTEAPEAQFGNRIVAGDLLEIDGNFTWNGVVYDAPGTGEAVRMNRVLQPGGWGNVGLADAAHDFLTADQSTMMSTPVTFMSASVTVEEQGDTVIVSVSGRWARMGVMLFVLDGLAPDSVWTCTLALVCSEKDLPSGFGNGRGITASGGMLYVTDVVPPDSVWTCTLALVCSENDLPSGFGFASGITASGGMLYVTDTISPVSPDSVWTCTLALVCSETDLPSGFGVATGITASGGMLYITDSISPDNSVWTCTLALSCSENDLPSGFGFASGITASGGMLYVTDDANPDSVWTCTLALSCSETELPFSVGSRSFGIAASGDAPCEWRIARGTTELESIDLDESSPAMLLDGLTVIDRPAPGTYVYSAQMSTSTPETVCTAYQGGGVTPLPSLLVQVFYGS